MGKSSKFSLPKIEFKISEKVAVENLMMFLQYYDIDVEEIEEKKLKGTTETVLNRTVRFIRQEKIKVVKDEKSGFPKIIQNLPNGAAPLVYTKIEGKNKIAMDGFEDTENHQKMYALAGSICGIGEAGMLLLSGLDLSAAECIAFVFLQV